MELLKKFSTLWSNCLVLAGGLHNMSLCAHCKNQTHSRRLTWYCDELRHPAVHFSAPGSWKKWRRDGDRGEATRLCIFGAAARTANALPSLSPIFDSADTCNAKGKR